MSIYHEPVLLQQAIEGLAIKPDGLYVDCTFGGGGHAKAIAKMLGDNGRLFAFDQDADAANNVPSDEDKITFIPQNFQYAKKFLRLNGTKKVDGILADLGVSWHQFNTPERGFSIRFDESELDMRMNQEMELTAKKVLNSYTKEQLMYVFKQYGELPNAYHIVNAIAAIRNKRTINTVGDLKRLTEPWVKGLQNKFYAQMFQALRIEVNKEMAALESLLTQSVDLLNPEGRIVIIAYHSVEDRLVKNFFKKGSFDGQEDKDLYGNVTRFLKPVNKKVIVPSWQEIKQNPKARSAKLRIAEKI